MKRLLSLLLIFSIFSVSFSSVALAQNDVENAVETLEDAGLVVALDPPQASAEALLKLPTVYALPGTFMYWVNQVIEEIQLILTSDPEKRTSLLLSFSYKRLAEGYEAVKNGEAERAVASLKRYQDEQLDLTTSLNKLDEGDVNVKPYMDRLQEQLGIQQSLQEFVEQEAIEIEVKDEISQLLEISPVQRLAWQQYNQTMLLGESDVHSPEDLQSSQSATPSAKLSE